MTPSTSNQKNISKNIRRLISNSNFGLGPINLLRSKKLITELNVLEKEKLLNTIISDEIKSKKYNIFRLTLAHYLGLHPDHDRNHNFISRYQEINLGGGYLSKGTPVKPEQDEYFYDITIPFSFLNDSKPNFDQSLLFEDISRSEEKIDRLLRKVSPHQKNTRNTKKWYERNARAIREIYDNIIRHPFNQWVSLDLTNKPPLPKSQFWFVQIRRFKLNESAEYFSLLPNFSEYKTAIAEQGFSSTAFLAVCLTDDGPGIETYFNNFSTDSIRMNLKDIIVKHLTSGPAFEAGRGCRNAIDDIVDNGGYIAFLSEKRSYTAFNSHWITEAGGSVNATKFSKLDAPLDGTSIHMLIPYETA